MNPETPINPEVLKILEQNVNQQNQPNQQIPNPEQPKKLNITKNCKLCNIEYPISMFRPQSSMGDGRKNVCIACDNKRAEEYYKKNKEKRLVQVRSWIEKNKEKAKAYQEKSANHRYKSRKNKSVISPTQVSSNIDMVDSSVNI